MPVYASMSRLTEPYCFHPSWNNPVDVPLCQLTLPLLPLSTTHDNNSQLTTTLTRYFARYEPTPWAEQLRWPRSTLRHLPLVFLGIITSSLIELVENTILFYLSRRWPMIGHDQRCAICLSYFLELLLRSRWIQLNWTRMQDIYLLRRWSTLRHLFLVFLRIITSSLIENTILFYLSRRWPMIGHDQRCAICLSYFS